VKNGIEFTSESLMANTTLVDESVVVMKRSYCFTVTIGSVLGHGKFLPTMNKINVVLGGAGETIYV